MSPSLGSVRRLCWTGFLGLPIKGVFGLPNLGLSRLLCAAPLIMAEWYALVSRCLYQLACMPFSVLVVLPVSTGFILTPPPYRVGNVGLCAL